MPRKQTPRWQLWAETAGIILATIIVCLAIIMAIFVYRYYGYLHKYGMRRIYPSVLLSAVYGGLKTGDLLVMTASVHMFLNSVFFHSPFSHAGMVVVLGGEPYVAEAVSNVASAHLRKGIPPHRVTPARGEGTSLLPLRRLLRDYQGIVFLSRLNKPLSEERARAVERKAAEEHPFMQFFSRSMIVDRILLGRQDGTRHCFEWACDLVDAAGLRPAGKPRLPRLWSLTQAEALSDMVENGTPLVGGYRYTALVRLENDLCHLDKGAVPNNEG